MHMSTNSLLSMSKANLVKSSECMLCGTLLITSNTEDRQGLAARSDYSARKKVLERISTHLQDKCKGG